MHLSDLIGAKEASSILGVDRSTFNRWAATGVIPSKYKVSGETGARLFTRAEIERFDKDRRDREQLAKARADAKRAKTDIPLSGLEVQGGGDKTSIAS